MPLSGPILKAVHLIVVSRETLWKRPPAHGHHKMISATDQVGVSDVFLSAHHCHFDLKIHVLLAALAVALTVAEGSTKLFKDPAQKII